MVTISFVLEYFCEYPVQISSNMWMVYHSFSITGQRNLVLVHVSDQADCSATRALLGEHDKLFDCIVACERGATVQTSVAELSRYLMSVAKKGRTMIMRKLTRFSH